MTKNCENEIIQHKSQINNLIRNYKIDKTGYIEQLDNCNKEKKEIIDKNNIITLENTKIKDDYDKVVEVKNKECDEKLKSQKIEHNKFKANINSLAGGFKEIFNNFENKISGGIVGQIKANLKENYTKEVNNLKNINNINKLNGGGKLKGGNPILFTIGAVIKIILMTLGTFIFDWWPIMMILSFYCVYIEYKMTILTGQEIMGTPIIFLLGAYFCPCFWALGRLGMGWTTSKNTTPGLFNVLSKCTDDNITLNLNYYYGKPCKEAKCLYTTKDCFNALFGKNDNSQTSNITSNFSNINILGSNKK